jgi:hypothetical protein
MGFFSANISFKEGTHSNTATRRGIDNTPNEEQIQSMRYVAENIFQKVREHFNKPIRINSFFRGAELNKAIGGSLSSQHCKGEAIDVDGLGGLTNKEIYDYIKENLEFDQLIWEFGTLEEPDWVHFSLKQTGNRKQCLRASKVEGKTKYTVL